MRRSSKDETGASIRLSLRVLALTSLIVGLTCLVTLVIVVSLKDVDLLSTVALALAILAFVVQLIVFIVQGADTARATERGEELHTQSVLILAQIQERTQGTQKSVELMNTRLLEAVMGKVAGEGLPVESRQFAERVVLGVAASQRTEATQQTEDSSHPGWPPPLDPEAARALREQMDAWPGDDEADFVLAALTSLSATPLVDLCRLAEDVFRFSGPNSTFAPGIGDRPSHELFDAGLVEEVPGWEGLYTLSETGRRVGRFFTAAGSPPESYSALTAMRLHTQSAVRSARAAETAARGDGRA